MIGYTKSHNEYYKGDYITHKIKSAVSRSGGNYLHYELFNTLVNGSIYNKTLNTYHQDCRAGYSLLFIYPIRIRIVLSLIFYKAELESLTEYSEYIIEDQRVDALENLQLINKITKVQMSKSVSNLLRDELKDNIILYSSYLQSLINQLNINTEFDFREDSLETQIQKTFLLFGNNFSINKDFIDIVSCNNKTKAAIYICRHLNYKPVSINIINQAIEQWTIKNLNT